MTSAPGNAADFATMGARFQSDVQSIGSSGSSSSSASAESFAILAARQEVKKILADDEALNAFRTMVSIGLPVPGIPVILFQSFKRLEQKVRNPDVFMDAAIEYVEFTREYDAGFRT